MEEMKVQLVSFVALIAGLNYKHANRDTQQEKNMPIRKAMSAITGEEI